MSAVITVECPSWLTRTAFWTPVTPARVSERRTSGEAAWRSSGRFEISVMGLR
jgi:hypothetical protein